MRRRRRADDQVAGLAALLDSDYIGPVNIGNPDEFTVLELAGLVCELTGRHAPILFEARPIDDPVRRRPDVRLAAAQVRWKPAVPLTEGLTRTIAWFRDALGR